VGGHHAQQLTHNPDADAGSLDPARSLHRQPATCASAGLPWTPGGLAETCTLPRPVTSHRDPRWRLRPYQACPVRARSATRAVRHHLSGPRSHRRSHRGPPPRVGAEDLTRARAGFVSGWPPAGTRGRPASLLSLLDGCWAMAFSVRRTQVLVAQGGLAGRGRGREDLRSVQPSPGVLRARQLAVAFAQLRSAQRRVGANPASSRSSWA
jgi:hypothetical protein